MCCYIKSGKECVVISSQVKNVSLYQWVAQESMNIDVIQLEIFYILFNKKILLGHKLIICSMDFARSERGKKTQHVCKSKYFSPF